MVVKLSDYTKLKLLRALNWYPIIVLGMPYMAYRGLSLEEAGLIFGMYSFFMVLLEYPTGVIGDYYGHKVSVALSNLVSSISVFLFIFSGNFYFYLVLVFVLAVGNSLNTGSFTALVDKVDHERFKKLNAEVGSISDITLLFVALVYGFLAGYIGYEPLFVLSAFVYAVSFFVALSIDVKGEDGVYGNIFRFGLEGFGYAFSKHNVFVLVVVFSIF